MLRCPGVIVCALFVLSACGGSSGTRASATAVKTITEAGPGRADRVAALERLLDGRAPAPIADGKLLQIRHGDGELGPSDFQIFALIETGPSDIAAWRTAGAPLAGSPSCDAPLDAPAWWLSPAECATAVHRDVAWFSANDGAMAVLADGRVFIFTATR
jgi:hypothetical protein